MTPLYTYVVLTEPLTPEQRARVGWRNREGVEDKRNYVHYYRTTFDGRILWGGGDGVTYRDAGISPAYDGNPGVFALLEADFRQTFPQLHDVGFSHRWGGPVAITLPFVPYLGTTAKERFHYAFGYNGHGVAPSHTAAKLMAARVLGQRSELEALPFVDSKEARVPGGFVAWVGSELVRRSLKKQDAAMDAGESSGDMDPWLMRVFRKFS